MILPHPAALAPLWKAGASKSGLLPVSWAAHQLRMVFTFLTAWRKPEEKYFVTGKLH